MERSASRDAGAGSSLRTVVWRLLALILVALMERPVPSHGVCTGAGKGWSKLSGEGRSSLEKGVGRQLWHALYPISLPEADTPAEGNVDLAGTGLSCSTAAAGADPLALCLEEPAGFAASRQGAAGPELAPLPLWLVGGWIGLG